MLQQTLQLFNCRIFVQKHFLQQIKLLVPTTAETKEMLKILVILKRNENERKHPFNRTKLLQILN